MTHVETVNRTAELNDRFRAGDRSVNGVMFITQGVRAFLEKEELAADVVIKAIKEFNDFTEGNDPYGERDFGEVTIHEQRIWWRIDYYDLQLKYGSEDPSNNSITKRVLTILTPSEY